MGSIQQRFEVEQPVVVVYEAIAQPREVLQHLPGVTSVTQTGDGVYRLSLGSPSASHETEVHVVSNDELRRVEWRTSDGAWSGAVTAEPIGPARTAVGVHAESTTQESESPSATAIHDTLQAFKRELRLA